MTDQKRTLIVARVNHMSDEAIDLMYDFLSLNQVSKVLPKIGYENWDFARDIRVDQKLRDIGIEEETLETCVSDYTGDKFGTLSNWKARFFTKLYELTRI